MENRKNRVLTISFILLLALTTGCGISITRNNYYTYPDQRMKKADKEQSEIEHAPDTGTNTKYGQN